ncbi:MAG: hypothetical protein GSR72_00265 [Desulfurococcales archaeon]|nr:hypothetical protein [Desulfurococcales archaeon]
MVDSRYFCILSPGLCLAKGVVDTARRYTNPPRQRHYYSGNIELVRPPDYPNHYRIQPVRPNLPWWGWLNPALGLGYELFVTKKGREYVKHGFEEIGSTIEHGVGSVVHKIGGTISRVAEKASGPLSKAVTIILVILILLVILKVK